MTACPHRGLLSEGLASWEFTSFPLLPVHHSTRCSVSSAKLQLQAKGKTDKCIRATVLWSRGGRTAYRRGGRGLHSNFPNNPGGKAGSWLKGKLPQSKTESRKFVSQHFANSPSGRSSKGCRYSLINLNNTLSGRFIPFI